MKHRFTAEERMKAAEERKRRARVRQWLVEADAKRDAELTAAPVPVSVKMEQQDKRDENTVNAARAIEKQINNLALDEKGLAAELAQMHPTLQQTFMRVAVRFIQNIAAKEYTDGRNEASAKLAKKIVASISEDDWYLPLI